MASDKYGRVVSERMVQENDEPVRVSVIEQRNAMWIDIRKMWTDKDGKLWFGKGVRFKIESAADVLEAVNEVVVESVGG